MIPMLKLGEDENPDGYANKVHDKYREILAEWLGPPRREQR